MKETYNKLYALLTVFCICATLIYFNERYWLKPDIKKIDTVTVNDTVLKTDTVDTTIYKTIPKYIEKIKVDTVFDKNGDTIQLVTENKLYQDTICQNNDSLVLKSYISGVRPMRDSISVLWKKQETIITNTITIEKYIEKKKKLYISPQFGVGYGLTNKKVDIFLGVGVGLNL